ncbi:MAG TPA: S-methyl-5-thioribose-1-phosphate isomerase [Anaerolineaceae bacterium]|nr:S-methyl-5-thioribose-1-phosphate isomerase [Anaerolineaceae bacterium]
MRTIEWLPEKNQVSMIDQRRLPRRFEYLHCQTLDEMIEAIRSMAIRGAPALAVAGAYGMVLAALKASTGNVRNQSKRAGDLLIASRPTAVNLAWGVNRMLQIVNDESISDVEIASKLLSEAHAMAEEDIQINRKLAKNGASLINDGDTIIHHCNTGSLAVVDWGTALGAIRFAHEQGKHIHLLVDETRPRLQGARLTAWECEQYGIPYEIITDNAAGYFLRSGKVNKVFFGADRVAANGDVVNKVGTYMLSLAAHTNGVPVYSVFPLSTLDMSIPNGDLIPIEERDGDEVLGLEFHGEPVAPIGAKARNPAFDITPHELITSLVTEAGIITAPFEKNLARCVYNIRLEGK